MRVMSAREGKGETNHNAILLFFFLQPSPPLPDFSVNTPILSFHFFTSPLPPPPPVTSASWYSSRKADTPARPSADPPALVA